MQGRFPAGEFGLNFGPFQGSLRTSGDLGFDISEILARQIQVRELVLLIPKCEYDFPVCLLYLSDDVDCSLGENPSRIALFAFAGCESVDD